MIGIGCVFIPTLLVTTVAWSYLFDVKRGGTGMLGVLMGITGFVAVMSGWFLTLMVRDYRDRHRYPDRIGIGNWAALPPIVFIASVLLTSVLFQTIQRR